MKLIAEDISKVIAGRTILDHVNLEMESGRIYGFAGRNGSGKTMLFRALSGLMSVSSGRVLLDEKVLRRDFTVLPSLGIVLENAGMYPGMTGEENLRYLASLKHIAGQEDIRKTLERVGLDPDDTRKYRKYSMGMKQRLAIAQAVMEKPDVLMLDEPFNGLDESGVKEIRELIRMEKGRGALILLASHNREDMEILADELYHVEGGRIRRKEDESDE